MRNAQLLLIQIVSLKRLLSIFPAMLALTVCQELLNAVLFFFFLLIFLHSLYDAQKVGWLIRSKFLKQQREKEFSY